MTHVSHITQSKHRAKVDRAARQYTTHARPGTNFRCICRQYILTELRFFFKQKNKQNTRSSWNLRDMEKIFSPKMMHASHITQSKHTPGLEVSAPPSWGAPATLDDFIDNRRERATEGDAAANRAAAACIEKKIQSTM